MVKFIGMRKLSKINNVPPAIKLPKQKGKGATSVIFKHRQVQLSGKRRGQISSRKQVRADTLEYLRWSFASSRGGPAAVVKAVKYSMT
ncbi:MAG: hypothetical protein A2Y12_05720 [Planctomycetes bacterium GWF2_42_9]|nr:MAG: hypothetical protein A2Y12_05720 [Planctomycetes bacterium GWF2_42_9]